MATAQQILEMLPDLERYLAIKASEEMDEENETPEDEAAESPAHQAMEAANGTEQHGPQTGAKGPGMGVVIALKPKGGKVEGCPDCADGTPHEHAK